MQKVQPVIISGLPGKMATLLAKAIEASEQFSLLSMGLTGPAMTKGGSVRVGDRQIRTYPPADRMSFLDSVPWTLGEDKAPPILIVDFTHPDAVLENAEFYCRHELPFVMGTTGGDRARLKQIVEESHVSAVIAPNMAAQVVALQAAIEYMANTFPGAFSKFLMEVEESHQKGKADTSGTAKALIAQFNKLGVPFDVSQVEMVRDPAQQFDMGIPSQFLGGHGWHTYRLGSPDGTMQFQFVHNVSGRRPYVKGTMKALSFLTNQVEEGAKGRVFSMIDVLKSG